MPRAMLLSMLRFRDPSRITSISTDHARERLDCDFPTRHDTATLPQSDRSFCEQAILHLGCRLTVEHDDDISPLSVIRWVIYLPPAFGIGAASTK